MTTLIAQLSPVLARKVARAADDLGLSHEKLAREAVRLFVRAVKPLGRQAGRQAGRQVTRKRKVKG